MRKHYYEIDTLRGLAILLVLLGHSVIYVPINLMEIKWCETMYKYICMFHMPLFFIISGFLFTYKANYKVYIIQKIKRILVPYIIFSIIDLFPRHLFPSLINGNNPLCEDIYNIILFGGQYWFLYTLFYIFLVFPCIEKVIIKHKYSICPIYIILIIFRILGVTRFLLLDRFITYLFFFLIGYQIKGLYSDNLKNNFNSKLIAATLVTSFLIAGTLETTVLTSIIRAILGMLMSYSIIVMLEKTRINKLFKICGEYSLQLYLLNGFILVPTRVITVKILGISNSFLIISIIFLLNVIIGLLVTTLIINKVNILRFLSGIKKKTIRTK